MRCPSTYLEWDARRLELRDMAPEPLGLKSDPDEYEYFGGFPCRVMDVDTTGEKEGSLSFNGTGMFCHPSAKEIMPFWSHASTVSRVL